MSVSEISLVYDKIQVSLRAELDAEKVTNIAYNALVAIINVGLTIPQPPKEPSEQPAKKHTQNTGTAQDGKTAEAGLYQ